MPAYFLPQGDARMRLSVFPSFRRAPGHAATKSSRRAYESAQNNARSLVVVTQSRGEREGQVPCYARRLAAPKTFSIEVHKHRLPA